MNFNKFLAGAGIFAAAATPINNEGAQGAFEQKQEDAKEVVIDAQQTSLQEKADDTTYRLGQDSVIVENQDNETAGQSNEIEPTLDGPKPHFLTPEFESHVDAIDSIIDEIENDSTVLEIQDYVTNQLTDSRDTTISQMIEKSYENYMQSHPAGVSREDFANALLYTSLQKITESVNYKQAISFITFALRSFAFPQESPKKLNLNYGTFLLYELSKFSEENLDNGYVSAFGDDLGTNAPLSYEYFFGISKKLKTVSEIFDFTEADLSNENFLDAQSVDGFIQGYMKAIIKKTETGSALREVHKDNFKKIISGYGSFLSLYTQFESKYDKLMPMELEDPLRDQVKAL
jgi:hypothetical protein